MLISRSYEEYERWASRLHALQSKAEILKQQRPLIKQAEDRDHPWKTALASIAAAYYKKGPSPGKGTSGGDGFGASIWQTLLLHRKEWRLGHVEWRASLFGYWGYILLLSEGYARAADTTGASAWQCAFVPEDASPLVEEYVQANPYDTEAQRNLEILWWAATELRAVRWSGSPALARAIASAGLDGLEFRLARSGLTPDGAIGLHFRPVRDVPPGKEYEIGLALHCIVGLTFPTVVLKAGYQLSWLEPAYTIRLGPGVPMPAYYVTDNSDRVGPLQVTSSVGSSGWYIRVILMSGTQKDFARQVKVSLQVGPTFDTLRDQLIVLRS
jgi:hypothetical protein